MSTPETSRRSGVPPLPPYPPASDNRPLRRAAVPFLWRSKPAHPGRATTSQGRPWLAIRNSLGGIDDPSGTLWRKFDPKAGHDQSLIAIGVHQPLPATAAFTGIQTRRIGPRRHRRRRPTGSRRTSLAALWGSRLPGARAQPCQVLRDRTPHRSRRHPPDHSQRRRRRRPAGPPPPSAPTAGRRGTGLAGLKGRVVALGGTLGVGPQDSEFRVAAVLPLA